MNSSLGFSFGLIKPACFAKVRTSERMGNMTKTNNANGDTNGVWAFCGKPRI